MRPRRRLAAATDAFESGPWKPPNERVAVPQGPSATLNAILSLAENMMSSPFTHWFPFTFLNGIHLLEILILALLANRLVRVATNAMIQPAASQNRAAQQ